MNDNMALLRKGELAQGIEQLLIGLFSYVIILAGSMFLSRQMGAGLFGNYSVALAVLSIGASITLLGTDNAANRFVSKFYHEFEHEQLVKYFAWNMGLIKKSFKMSLYFSALLLIISIILHFTSLVKIHSYDLTFYALWLIPLAAFTMLLSSYIISFHRVLLGTVYKSFLVHVFILLYFLIAVYVFGLNIKNNFIIVSVWLLSFATLLFIEILTLKFHKRFADLLTAITAKNIIFNEEMRHLWYSTSIHLILSRMMYLIIRYIDLFVVRIFSTDPSAAGQYSIIMIITHIIYFIPVSIVFLIRPTIGESYDKPEEYPALQEALNSVNIVIYLTTPIFLFIIIYWRAEILALFGPAFVEAKLSLIILSLGVSVLGLTRVARALLTFSGNELVVLGISVISLLLLVLLGIPATILYGLEGMAIVVALSCIFQGLACVVMSKYYLPKIKSLIFI